MELNGSTRGRERCPTPDRDEHPHARDCEIEILTSERHPADEMTVLWAALAELRPTVMIVHPDIVDQVRTRFAELGIAHAFDIRASELCPPGQALLPDPRA